MRRGIKVLIIILVILTVLVVLAGVGIFVFLRTDLFKSDKQLFFKYVAENAEIMDIFQEDDLIAYFQKEQTTAYENSGTLRLSKTTGTQDTISNNFKITFSGMKDETNHTKEQNIVLDYGNNVTIPLQYKQSGNVYAIKSEYIGQNYIGIKDDGTTLENYNLEEIREIDSYSSIKEAILKMQEIPTDTINSSLAKYLPTIYSALDNQYFSKTETGYQLHITSEVAGALIQAIGETLKTDQNVIDIWLETYPSSSEEEWEDMIDEMLSSVDIEALDIDIIIEVVVENHALKETIIRADEIELSLRRQPNQIEAELSMGDYYTYEVAVQKAKGTSLTYAAQLRMLQNGKETMYYDVSAEFTGLGSNQTVTEEYQLTMRQVQESMQWDFSDIDGISMNPTSNQEETLEITYYFETTKTFVEDYSFIPLTNVNMLLINDLPQDQQTALLKAIIDRWFYVSELQMEELGTTEMNNPIYTIYPELQTMDADDIEPMTNYTSQLAQNAIEAYNGRLINYQGEQDGSAVRMLLSTISAINNIEEEDTEQVVRTIIWEGITYEATASNIEMLATQIRNDERYSITFGYGEGSGNGYIQHVTIQQR